MKTEITHRDYFAAKVLQGIYSNPEMWRSICMDAPIFKRDRENDTINDYVAQQCYEMADAMIKERSKRTFNKS